MDAPPLPPAGSPAPPVRLLPPALPHVGERIGDFELEKLLGEGSFGRVFLARQVSLNRHVALKVTANRGSEARTLASLEHDHIVQVFAEEIEPGRNLRLMCMQYIAGTTLDKLIAALGLGDMGEQAGRAAGAWTGRDVLTILDDLSRGETSFDPTALRDRDLLAAADHIQATCWLVARLAEALGYAHDRGILHRDIKPANVLINRSGRPMLADFNLALDLKPSGEGPGMFGGTLPYMSPEHLEAFNREVPIDRVTRRSDIYSLGVVLYELLTGARPFADEGLAGPRTEVLRTMVRWRRERAPSPQQRNRRVPETLDRVVRRCLDPEPDRRFASAWDLAKALEGCRHQRAVERELPPLGRLTRAAERHPFRWLMVFAVAPNLIAGIPNIWYNAVRIVGNLTDHQEFVFRAWLIPCFNVLAYGFGLWILFRIITPVHRTWKRLQGGAELDETEATALRQKALRFPLWAVGVAAVAWVVGGVIFPLVLDIAAGPVAGWVYWHFLYSFTISGLIAVTYSYFGVEYVTVRVLYSRFWADPAGLRLAAADELRAHEPRLRLFELLAAAIPLAGALMLILGAPMHFPLSYRLLVGSLLVLGMIGLGIALLVGRLLTRTLTVLTGTQRAAPVS